jgi:hypothetical protein
MKHIQLSIFVLAVLFLSCQKESPKHPRVFVFTDINIDKGDPDDRQSLIHLLWYANELNIEGIVPDRLDAHGLEACQMVIDAYKKDYQEYNFEKKGYPSPEILTASLATNADNTRLKFEKAASDTTNPLWVLVWGSMENFGNTLRQYPHLAKNIRLITIGTDLMMEEYRQYIPEGWGKTDQPCKQYNWNGQGRNQLFNDQRFSNMWWLEINWTYEGMFTGDEPAQVFEKLLKYGEMGNHMAEVVKNQAWARYFRVGDTPSVLYVIDPQNDLDDPTKGSWAGKFTKPFPQERPNYFTDYNGPVDWDYKNPCKTWQNHVEFNRYAKGTLEVKRPEMYQMMFEKLNEVYQNKQDHE